MTILIGFDDERAGFVNERNVHFDLRKAFGIGLHIVLVAKIRREELDGGLQSGGKTV